MFSHTGVFSSGDVLLTRSLPFTRPLGLPVYVARLPSAPFSARVGVQNKNPAEMNPAGFLFWRRPTLAQPIAVLPSGLQRFTAVFGMGTGGATALVSPEVCSESFGANFWCVIRNSVRAALAFFCRFTI